MSSESDTKDKPKDNYGIVHSINDHPGAMDSELEDSNHIDEEESQVDEEGDDADDEDVDDEEVDDEVATPFSYLTLMSAAGIEMKTLKDIAELIKSNSCRNILVLSGAGVSVSAGIPDFRTPGTGLYDNLQKYNLPFPEAVFDLDFYRSNPQPFVSLARELWPGTSGISPTLSHMFVKLLQDKNLLLRNYTQNIDGLEVLAGVSPDKMMECHGHFRSASCIDCKWTHDGDLCKQKILEGVPPTCDRCGGLVKPDIVFFGESMPHQFGNMIHSDIRVADLLIVMGTSLQVAPVSLIPEIVDDNVPRVLFNRDLVGDFFKYRESLQRDVWEKGDCDDSVEKFCDLLGWSDEIKKLMSRG